jgi:hypothetical protein
MNQNRDGEEPAMVVQDSPTGSPAKDRARTGDAPEPNADDDKDTLPRLEDAPAPAPARASASVSSSMNVISPLFVSSHLAAAGNLAVISLDPRSSRKDDAPDPNADDNDEDSDDNLGLKQKRDREEPAMPNTDYDDLPELIDYDSDDEDMRRERPDTRVTASLNLNQRGDMELAPADFQEVADMLEDDDDSCWEDVVEDGIDDDDYAMESVEVSGGVVTRTQSRLKGDNLINSVGGGPLNLTTGSYSQIVEKTLHPSLVKTANDKGNAVLLHVGFGHGEEVALLLLRLLKDDIHGIISIIACDVDERYVYHCHTICSVIYTYQHLIII